MALERRVVTYSGVVQGVGFRYLACRLAERFEVTGYIRNVPDGTVEVVVESDHAEIDRFLAAIREQMGGYIRHVNQQITAHQNEFRGFNVRY